MSKKKVIIIGAGVSGLSCGSYLQSSGFDTEIFELHTLPGGLCTSWDRKGYTIDGCIHWLVGSSQGNNFYKLWNELIDMESLTFVNFDEYFVVEDESGQQLHFYTDLDKLKEELLRISPADASQIKIFIDTVRKFMKLDLPVDKAQELYTAAEGFKLFLKILPYMKDFMKLRKLTGIEYSKKFLHPLLQKAFASFFLPEMSAVFFIINFAWMCNKAAGYPVGGSLKFAQLLEEAYLKRGGIIHYRARVDSVLVEDGNAKGVILSDGRKFDADIVISAADGYSTIFGMLKGQFVDKKIQKMYASWKSFPSYIQASFGINQDLSSLPHSLIFPLKKNIQISPDFEVSQLNVRIFHFDRTLAPEGKTVMVVFMPVADSDYWIKMRKENRKDYEIMKERITNEIQEAIVEKLRIHPGSIEMCDLSTPATVVRYTENHNGSFEGWVMTPSTPMSVKKTLPGLNHFYMIGQWVEPGGGLPPALMSGRNLAQLLAKKEGLSFSTGCIIDEKILTAC